MSNKQEENQAKLTEIKKKYIEKLREELPKEMGVMIITFQGDNDKKNDDYPEIGVVLKCDENFGYDPFYVGFLLDQLQKDIIEEGIKKSGMDPDAYKVARFMQELMKNDLND